MKGKLIKFSSEGERMWEKALDARDMAVLEQALRDKLECYEHAIEVYHEDKLKGDARRLRIMLGLIYMEVEDETN